MDYVFKIALKKTFECLMRDGILNADEVRNIYIHCDEHSTATHGRYELREGLEQEFKIGTMNFKYMIFYPPIFHNMENISLRFCDSKTLYLVRAADIVANRIYHKVLTGEITTTNKQELQKRNLYITFFP